MHLKYVRGRAGDFSSLLCSRPSESVANSISAELAPETPQFYIAIDIALIFQHFNKVLGLCNGIQLRDK